MRAWPAQMTLADVKFNGFVKGHTRADSDPHRVICERSTKTMSAAKRIRPRPPMRAALAIVGALVSIAAIVAWTNGSSAYAAS